MNIIFEAEKELQEVFNKLDEIALLNQKKVLNAFQEARVSLSNMAGSSGYGYDDTAKGKLADIYKYVFHTEGAIVSPLLTSGTHTLSVALSGILRPGDKMLSITGDVYDSLQTAVYGDNVGSLKDFGVSYSYIDMIGNDLDEERILKTVASEKPRMVYIQRSAGYSSRETLSIETIGDIISKVKEINNNTIVFVDNCYGTFSDTKEPSDVGADVVVGSLIKNAGGGIAPTGGYIVGRADLITLIEYRLYGVGLGSEVGSYAYGYQNFFEGFFIAPNVVRNAIKGSALVGAVLAKLGVNSSPETGKIPRDLIRQIRFDNKDKMINFIKLVQKCSPVDSYLSPEPWAMPGYDAEVIMAAGGFVQGASIEMSADGPVKAPYIAYFQGGITYEQVKLFAMELAQNWNNI